MDMSIYCSDFDSVKPNENEIIINDDANFSETKKMKKIIKEKAKDTKKKKAR